MEKTPNFKSKSKHIRNGNQDVFPENLERITNCKALESESPGYIPCTQEGFENIDVGWDWNSPQSKRIPKKSQKRLALLQSPGATFKRHLSNNSIQGFEKLQEELRLLKEEIAVPEHEESLLLSPIEEAEYKNVDSTESIHNIELENFLNQADDFFDDSLDDQLLVCATQADSNLNNVNLLSLFSKFSNNNTNVKIQIDRHNSINSEECDKYEEKNSFFNNTEFEKTVITEKSLKENKPITVGKVEFYRTQSFEMSHLGSQVGVAVNQKEEIKRRRQEALAKLELKKKQGTSISPMPCSSAEIERKRQEALAKREARKQQGMIEKKRQDALKRLEINRKKNAQIVKSSLTSRLT